MERRRLLGIGIDTGSCRSFAERIAEYAGAGRSAYVCLANAHMTVEANRDPAFAAVLAGADLVTADGMPLVRALRLLHGVRQERVAGVDLLLELLHTAEGEGLPVFLYGETRPVLEGVLARVRREFPQLRLAGAISPPFRALSAAEEANDAEVINASGARLVLVALGCPKQERWMARHRGRVAGVMVGLGGALAVYARVRRRAPAWVRRCCLEWLYRLGQEPCRLWRRYLVTNTRFLALLGRELLGRAGGRSPSRPEGA